MDEGEPGFPAPVRLKDIAARCGVSTMAVSLALRESHRVSEKTRLQVMRCAEEMGYRRDPAMSALSAYRARLPRADKPVRLAKVVFLGPEGVVDPRAPVERVDAASREYAARLGYELLDEVVRGTRQAHRELQRRLLNRGVAGILAVAYDGSRTPMFLNWGKFSVVVKGERPDGLSLHAIRHSNYENMIRAMDEVAQRGYKRVGFVVREAVAERSSRRWLAAYQAMRAGRPGLFLPPYVERGEQWEYERVARWVAERRVDCLIGGLPSTGCDVLRAAGCRIPGEIGFLSLDTEPGRADVSGFDQRKERDIYPALDLLAQMVQMGRKGMPKDRYDVVVGSTWVEGTTLPWRVPGKIGERDGGGGDSEGGVAEGRSSSIAPRRSREEQIEGSEAQA